MQKKNMKAVNTARAEQLQKARELVNHTAYLEEIMTAFQPLLRRLEDVSGYEPGDQINVGELIEASCYWIDRAVKAQPDLLPQHVHLRRAAELEARVAEQMKAEEPLIKAFLAEQAIEDAKVKETTND